MVTLYPHQRDAIEKLKSGSILCGGVGSGKSLTSLTYYYEKICFGKTYPKFTKMKKPKNLYIITTARKRDSLEWELELAHFLLSTNSKTNPNNITIIIDSWNNIKKYNNVINSFFIFDEQRLVGNGVWVKSFLKITNKNPWILLTATPGDSFSDYVPIFIANRFFRNKTEFERNHVVYSRFSKFPKIEGYIGTKKLLDYKHQILVVMPYAAKAEQKHNYINCEYNKELYKKIIKDRWNIFTDKPIRDAGELCHTLRRVVNSDPSRMDAIIEITKKHKRVIVFYNFNYELENLRILASKLKLTCKEWNGHVHESVPKTDSWLYLVQYTAGAEAWNCITTNCIVFLSQNYSYKIATQAAGRIDRMNTPFKTLNYYHLKSTASIDIAIKRALDNKKNFNQEKFGQNNSHAKHAIL